MARLKATLGDELMHPSDYLAAIEFRGKDVTLTIAKVYKADLMLVGGKSERRTVIEFQRTQKKFVVNKTNASTIAKLHGTRGELWVGKAITLYPTTCRCGAETVDCVRVRESVAAGQRAALRPGEPTDDEKRAILEQEREDAGR